MLLAIPPGRSFGDLISATVFVVLGIWLLYVWPRSIRRQIARGNLSEEDGQARLRMCPPKSGYVSFLAAIALMSMWLFNNGFFRGTETIVGVLMLAFSLGLLAFALWQTRKAKR
jgi:hypothetical protein